MERIQIKEEPQIKEREEETKCSSKEDVDLGFYSSCSFDASASFRLIHVFPLPSQGNNCTMAKVENPAAEGATGSVVLAGKAMRKHFRTCLLSAPWMPGPLSDFSRGPAAITGNNCTMIMMQLITQVEKWQ